MRCSHDALGTVRGLMTTVHAVNAAQPAVDGASKKGQQRGRAAFGGIFLSSTGDVAEGMAIRVPAFGVSVTDVTGEPVMASTYRKIGAEVKRRSPAKVGYAMRCGSTRAWASTCPPSVPVVDLTVELVKATAYVEICAELARRSVDDKDGFRGRRGGECHRVQSGTRWSAQVTLIGHRLETSPARSSRQPAPPALLDRERGGAAEVKIGLEELVESRFDTVLCERVSVRKRLSACMLVVGPTCRGREFQACAVVLSRRPPLGGIEAWHGGVSGAPGGTQRVSVRKVLPRREGACDGLRGGDQLVWPRVVLRSPWAAWFGVVLRSARWASSLGESRANWLSRRSAVSRPTSEKELSLLRHNPPLHRLKPI